jgi:transposase
LSKRYLVKRYKSPDETSYIVFAVIPQRWVVERSFARSEKCRRHWKNCERKLHTGLPFIVLAFLVVLFKRF